MPAEEAAVLVILREHARGREVLLIRRAVKEGDPWSGQMAFPGGRAEAGDPDRLATALRETEEEVGLSGAAFAAVPDFFGIHRPGNRPDLEVSVYVTTLRPGSERGIVRSPEVDTALWIPLEGLTGQRRTIVLPGDRGKLEVDGFVWQDVFIWGLTYRILTRLLEAGR